MASTEEKKKIPVAVALAYDMQKDISPRIAASGKGRIAEQIIAVAFEHGVNVRKDAELAEMLSMLELDSPIPIEAYAAVAEILTYVYKANAAAGKARQTGGTA